jgi:hypothetical protein
MTVRRVINPAGGGGYQVHENKGFCAECAVCLALVKTWLAYG